MDRVCFNVQGHAALRVFAFSGTCLSPITPGDVLACPWAFDEEKAASRDHVCRDGSP
jgi:hypothetical protein